MSRYAVLAITACLLLSGCRGGNPRQTSTAPPPAVVETSHVDPATGNLIALWMPGGMEVEPVLVTDPYAVYISWPNEEWEPNSADKRVFIFYDNVAKKCYQTRDFDAFVEVVAQQPQDIAVIQIDTCTASRCYMPQEHWDRLNKILAAGNRKWGVSRESGREVSIFCYCQHLDKEFVYPGDRPEWQSKLESVAGNSRRKPGR